MKRLTTDTPKDNLEAALNLFYIKDHETWVRGGGPGPEYADVSLFSFIRDVVKTHIPDVELPEDDDDLSNMMPEWLMDGIDSAEGIVALLYTAAWAYAELRHKLMRYEDTGLEPEDIKKHEAAYNECLTRTYGPFKQKISQWLQAEQDGKLVVIPWAAGDVIYEADPAHGVVKHTFAGEPAWMMHSYAVDDAGNEWYDGWGSSDETPFYKTREEAEAELSRKGGAK